MLYQTKIVNERKGLDDFLELPFHLYRDDPSWVAPLRSEVLRVLDAKRNPYFDGVALEKFICYRDGRPSARGIVVINPKHWAKFDKKTAFFGFFESEKDEQSVQSLFGVMEEYCVQQGAEYLEGPFNPNHYSELGLLVKNFSPPAFLETYNPEYYADLLTSAGFQAILPLHTRFRDTQDLIKRDFTRLKTQAEQAGFTIRSFNLFRMRSELERIREVFNDAFGENWHFLPLSREEYLFSAQSMFLVTNPLLVQIVEHHGKPVGVLQFVLNVNPVLAQMKGRMGPLRFLQFIRRHFAVREIVLYAIGVKKAYRGSLVFKMLLDAFYRLARRYRRVYCTWMSDTNLPVISAAEHTGLVPYKWFEIFGKPVKKQDK